MASGDHVFVYCGAYSHHGIDCGDGRVIHFDSTPWQKLAGVSKSRCPAMIKCVSLADFSQGREVLVRDYWLSVSSEVTVTRAWSRVGEQGYHLFDNNCEHFAVWCKTGRSDSTQVRSLLDAACPIGRQLPVATLLFRASRVLPLQVRLAAFGTALSVTAGSVAARYLSNRLRNYRNGES